jgi:hypothetical protein
MDPQYQMELLAFGEKVALAELEESKSHERVMELKYQAARYNLDYFRMVLKQQEAQAKGA